MSEQPDGIYKFKAGEKIPASFGIGDDITAFDDVTIEVTSSETRIKLAGRIHAPRGIEISSNTHLEFVGDVRVEIKEKPELDLLDYFLNQPSVLNSFNHK